MDVPFYKTRKNPPPAGDERTGFASFVPRGMHFEWSRGVHAALDIGSKLTTCLVGEGRKTAAEGIDVLACVVKPSGGVERGNITNIRKAVKIIGEVLGEAEKKAGCQIERITLNLSCGTPQTHKESATLELNGRHVELGDLLALREVCRQQAAHRSDKILTDILPLKFRVDSQCNIFNPLGLVGTRFLEGVFLLIFSERGPYLTLRNVLEQLDIGIAAAVPDALASGIAALTPEEWEYGATVIDIGYEKTTWAVFFGHRLHAMGTLEVGSHHITRDLAHALSLSILEADRLKMDFSPSFGEGKTGQNKSPEETQEQEAGRKTNSTASARQTEEVISSRVQEIMKLIRRDLDRLTDAPKLQNVIVLTGGGALLPGLAEWAQPILKRPVRIGQPLLLQNYESLIHRFRLPPDCGTVLTSAIGLLGWSMGANRVFSLSSEDSGAQMRPGKGFTRFLRGLF